MCVCVCVWCVCVCVIETERHIYKWCGLGSGRRCWSMRKVCNWQHSSGHSSSVSTTFKTSHIGLFPDIWLWYRLMVDFVCTEYWPCWTWTRLSAVFVMWCGSFIFSHKFNVIFKVRVTLQTHKSYNQNMTISAISSKLLIILHLHLVWWYLVYHCNLINISPLFKLLSLALISSQLN